ncbi:MAG TPA: glycosyltransferase family 39 protein [Candidatus Eisenbacteria bacterium]|nr:glycosyltransferase family 39 protein [Candidatus Eisenbacteria bacterium]
MSAALWGILLLALGLRLWHVAEGLPDFFEEAFPFRRAFEMAGFGSARPDWNPRAFHYPSLSFYLHLVVQQALFLAGQIAGEYRKSADFFVAYQIDPTPMALAGRALGVAADLATVVAVARIGERLRRGAGLLAALLVALSAILIRQSHAIVTDGLMTAFAAWALERMVVYRSSGRWSAWVLAAMLTGLAAGTKYPAALLALPLLWTIFARAEPRRGIRTLYAVVLAGLVFAATSPFLISNFAQARFDWLRIANLVGEGQLGSFGKPGALYYVRLLARDFGWIAPLALAASLLWLRRRTQGTRGISIVWLYLVAFLLPILLGRVEFERYLAPVVPAIALLLAATVLELPDLLPRLDARARGIVRLLLMLAVAAPACASAFTAASVGGDTTQGQARRFVERMVGADQLLVQEAHGAAVRERRELLRIVATPAYAASDSSWRRRFEGLPVARSVRLPLLVAGRAVVVAPDSQRGRREIELFPSSADLNRVFYEPALFIGVDWVLTSDAVRGRYESDSTRYAVQHRFYRLLESAADSVIVLRSGGTVTGPEIRIYRLGARFRSTVTTPLDPLWWTRDIPPGARAELASAMSPMGVPRAELDPPPSWVLALGVIYEQQIQPFAYALALELHELSRCDPAEALARSILKMDPAHVQATGLVATCAEARGDWIAARDAVARLLELRDPERRSLPDIRLEYARLLAQTGDRDEARRQLNRVLGAPLTVGDTQRRARAMLQALDSER